MKKAYKIALFAALILLSLPSHAQYFDWVKSYSGQDPAGGGVANEPVGIVHDSEGNIYYLGQFGVGAGIDTTHFLPIAPSGPGINTAGAVIAKFSPAGEMLWHKVVYSNDNQHTSSYQIQMLGDTAIACLMEINQPDGYGLYTYFLDTLLRAYDGYFVDNDSVMKGSIGALLTFNLDGELIERHMMQTAYFDTTGNLLKPYGEIQTMPLGAHHFCIDNEGNIILLRTAQDYAPGYGSLTDGSVTGLRFIIDGHKYFDFSPTDRPQSWEHQILKFSPHFNDLLYTRYIIEPSTTHVGPMLYNIEFSSMLCDSLGNYYITATMVDARQDLSVTNDSSFVIKAGGKPWHGFLVKYNTTGEICYLKQLEYRETASEQAATCFGGMAIDYTDTTIIVPSEANSQSSSSISSNFMVDDSILNLSSGLCFLRFNLENGRFLSMGTILSNNYCGLLSTGPMPQIATRNNRVALSFQYSGALYNGDSLLAPNPAPERTCGLAIWGKDGQLLNFIDYHTHTTNDRFGSSFFADSSLYISAMLNGNATLGTINVPYQGNSTAVLARYVDTAFLMPYRNDNDTNDNDTGSVRIIMVGDGDAFVAYPNPFRQRVVIEMKNEELRMKNGIVTAILTDISGRREQVRLTPSGERRAESGEHVYTLDLTSRPQATYLLTLTTASGKTHTIRLLKQSDIFGE